MKLSMREGASVANSDALIAVTMSAIIFEWKSLRVSKVLIGTLLIVGCTLSENASRRGEASFKIGANPRCQSR